MVQVSGPSLFNPHTNIIIEKKLAFLNMRGPNGPQKLLCIIWKPCTAIPAACAAIKSFAGSPHIRMRVNDYCHNHFMQTRPLIGLSGGLAAVPHGVFVGDPTSLAHNHVTYWIWFYHKWAIIYADPLNWIKSMRLILPVWQWILFYNSLSYAPYIHSQ